MDDAAPMISGRAGPKLAFKPEQDLLAISTANEFSSLQIPFGKATILEGRDAQRAGELDQTFDTVLISHGCARDLVHQLIPPLVRKVRLHGYFLIEISSGLDASGASLDQGKLLETGEMNWLGLLPHGGMIFAALQRTEPSAAIRPSLNDLMITAAHAVSIHSDYASSRVSQLRDFAALQLKDRATSETALLQHIDALVAQRDDAYRHRKTTQGSGTAGANWNRGFAISSAGSAPTTNMSSGTLGNTRLNKPRVVLLLGLLGMLGGLAVFYAAALAGAVPIDIALHAISLILMVGIGTYLAFTIRRVDGKIQRTDQRLQRHDLRLQALTSQIKGD